MLIDWFTVVAQAINFLVLVWLLKRFLYKPILDAIDAREQRIAKELADADATKAEASRERDEFHRKNEEFDHQRHDRMNQLKDEIRDKRQRLLDDAQQAADDLSAKRQEAWRREQQSISDDISRRTRDQVFSITRKTLHDLANTSLEERIADVFTSRLRELNGEAKQEIAAALTKSSEPARVRTAFELPSEQQTAIREALEEIFEADIPVRFETAPEVVGGIELTANGRQVAWSIDGYLTELKKSIAEATRDRPQPAVRPAATRESKS